MKRWLKRSVQIVVACGALAFGFSEDGPAGDCTPSLQGPLTAAAHHYRMKGKVRLLLFWVGKDNVGGGTVTLLPARDPKANCWAGVIFGQTESGQCAGTLPQRSSPAGPLDQRL